MRHSADIPLDNPLELAAFLRLPHLIDFVGEDLEALLLALDFAENHLASRFNLAKLSLDDAVGRDVAAALGAERMVDGRVYVADPRGQVILSYPPDVEQKELLRDLKRLLAGSDS